MRFVDEARITVRSGKGGNGCASFRRERFIPRGGPDGGDGGRGGDVIFRTNHRLMTLQDFRVKRIYEARNGQAGMGKDRYGKAADNLVVELPVGTMIYEVAEDGGEELLVDLVEDGQEAVICKGGDGGRGNLHFKSSTNRAPRRWEPGWPGEEKVVRLELKILADAGLLGFPNAGKSTFISAVSAARPKIAPYPFTTLSPNLGVMEGEWGERLIIADIPGLVEGAGQGRGLGHTFLKHVERTRFLVHILSAEEIGEEDPWAGYELLNEELEVFESELGHKPQITVVNKIDLLEPEALEALKTRAKADGKEIFFISALNGDGVEELSERMWAMYKDLNKDEEAADE